MSPDKINYWRASVTSETLTGVTQLKIGDVCYRASDNAKSGICYWLARVASETLTGVKMKKIGYVCLLASERSERDTIRYNSIEISLYLAASVACETVLGVDNAKSGICYMYICMWDGTYAL